MEKCPSLHFGVVAIEKGAFRSPLTKVANFTFLLLNPFGIICKQNFDDGELLSFVNKW